MTTTGNKAPETSEQAPRSSTLSPEARRALEEAELRRRQAAEKQTSPAEVGGRGGLEPTRYGDWESGGITSDF
jgi:hypothetical protein